MDTRRGHTWGSLRARRVAGIVALATAISVSVLAPLGSAAPGDPAPQVTLSPGALVFADRPVGTRADAQAITLTNTGDAPLTLSTFHLSGPDTADFGLGVMCPINPDTVQPGSSCLIYVSFTPDSPGAKSATLVIGDDAGTQTVDLSGAGATGGGGTPDVRLSTDTLAFGAEIVNIRSSAQEVTVTNSGTGPLTISTFRINGADAVDFAQGADCPVSPSALPAGSSCSIYVSFDPDSDGQKSATLAIGDDADGGTQTVALTGRGSIGFAEATASPGALTFADRTVGSTSDAQAVTVTNTGAEALAIFTFRLTGQNPEDFAQGADCPVSPNLLPAGASCTIYVSFTPHDGGLRTASLVVGDSAPSSPQTVALSGRGLSAPEASISPGALTFDSQTVGTTSPQQTVALSNTGGGPLHIAGISLGGDGAADFTQGGNCPATLAAGASCSITVTFAPSTEGLHRASLTVSDDAANSPQAVSLSGAGVASGTYFHDDFESGSLAQWDALTSPGSSVALDSTYATSGTSSARLTNTGGDESTRIFANLAGGGHSQTYTHFCFRIQPGLSEGIEIANGRAITSEYPLGIRRFVITYNPVTQTLEAYFFNEALDRLDLYAPNGLVTQGAWHCAELYLDESVNGEAALSLDGSVVGTVHGDLGTPSPYDRVYLWNQPAAGSVWFDDVAVAASPIGS